MIEFVEYKDDKIRIKLPKQLRKKRPIRFFQGNLVRGRPETMMAVAIDLNFDDQRVEAVKKIFISSGKNQTVSQPEGYKVLRSGPCRLGEGGREFFSSSEIFDKGYTLYCWDVFYKLQGHYVELNIMGGGSRESFEKMAKEIITSLKLISPEQSEKRDITSSDSMIKSVKNGGLNTKEKARLASVLESLPEDLRYLREPILAIADEDQDLLGSGEIDTNLLAKAIEQQAVSQPKGFAANQAKELEKWLKSNTSEKDTWTGPAWFVMSFLMGYDMFVNNKLFGKS